MLNNHRSFTIHFNGNVDKIQTDIGIGQYLPNQEPSFEEYSALWDTGATISCISPKIATELKLPVYGLIEVGGINDSVEERPKHMASIRLPNGLVMNQLVVGTQPAGTDILIGMDIISKGDFAISHDKDGNAHMSFVFPPLGKKIDFDEKMRQEKLLQKAKLRKRNRKHRH